MFSRRFLAAHSGAFLLTASLASPAFAESLPNVLSSSLAGTATPALGALVIRNGKIDDLAVYGVRRLGRPERVQNGDAWLIGSCTKPMTVALIARLVDRGVLSWDAPLSAMLPDQAQIMRREYRSVTLIQLLSHQSGLPLGDEALGNRFFSDRRPLPQQRLAFIMLALKEPPVSAPGTAVHYSNIGFIVAAVIAERATGVPYEDFMRREIFQPIGMSSAAFGPPPDGGPAGHQNGRPATPTDSVPALFGPAGFVRVSLTDWAEFCLDQLAGAKGRGRLLSPASYHLMQNPLPGIEDGLGWGIDPSVGGRKGPVLSHSGSDGNWKALVVLFPATGDGILVVANAGQSMGGDKSTTAAFKALLPTVGTPE